MQPVYKPQRGDLERRLAAVFPDEADRGRALELLMAYAEGDRDAGFDRVRIAALYNSHGSLEKLSANMELANIDYRDVIASAEYRSLMELPHDTAPGSREYAQAIEDDAERYSAWLDASGDTAV